MAKTFEERVQCIKDVEEIRKLFSAHAYLLRVKCSAEVRSALPVPYKAFDETMSFVPPAAPQDL